MLHGEQYLEVLRPISSEGTLDVHCRVVDMLDKGSGTVVLVEGEIRSYGVIIPSCNFHRVGLCSSNILGLYL